MTTYRFTDVNYGDADTWDDATVWDPATVPNVPDAEIVLPASTSTYDAVYSVSIGTGEAYAVRNADVGGFAKLVVNGGLTLSGGLTLLGNSYVAMNGTLAAAAGQNAGTLAGSGQAGFAGALVNGGAIVGEGLTLTAGQLQNTGELDARAGAGLTVRVTGGVGAFSNLNNGVLTGGSYAAENGSALYLDAGGIITTDAATIILDNAGGFFSDSIPGGGDPALQSTLEAIAAGGTLDLVSQNYVAAAPLTINGTLQIGMTSSVSGALMVGQSGTIVGNGAIAGPVVNNGTIASRLDSPYSTPIASTLVIQGSLTGDGALVVGAGQVGNRVQVQISSTLELTGAVSENVSFADVSGILRLDNPAGFTGSIAPVDSQFGEDAVALVGLSLRAMTGYSYVGAASGGTLTIYDGAIVETLNYAGDQTSSIFSFAAGYQPAGYPPILEVREGPLVTACYCRGAGIRTDRGDVAVEALRHGDLVMTALGELRPVRWIGMRSYAAVFVARNPGVHPVRFAAGSLGGGLPGRDLLVSPDHAMFLDGLLIPARFLLNGATVTQERPVGQVDYFHVELHSHDILLAEGAPAESFLDEGNRGQFHNAREQDARDHSASRQCAPRVESGAGLEAVRRRLAAEATCRGQTAAAPRAA